MVAVALLLGSVGSVLGLTVSTFADLQAALQVDEAVITVGADITVTESASDSAGLRVPAGVRATVSGPATLSGDGQFAILYVEGELNATALVFEGGYTGTYDESYDCGVDGNNYGDGGAVLVAANGRFHAKECDFLGNTGGWGGAIHVSAGAWAATTACVLSGNDAKGRRSCGCGNANCCGCTDSRGGAVFVSASGEYSDDNGLFLLNSALAGGGGGALYVTAGGTFAGWGTQFLDNAANNNDGQHVLVEDASVAASVACPAASSAMTSVEIGCGPGACVFSLTNCRAPASGARAVRSYVDALSDDAADVATLVQAQATTHSVASVGALATALLTHEAVIDVTSDITATSGASSTAGLRVPRGHVVTLKTSVDGGVTLSGAGQYAIIHTEGQLNVNEVSFADGFTGQSASSVDCGNGGNNYADGGAVHVDSASRLVVADATFSGCVGGYGGAVFVGEHAFATMQRATFEDNEAKGHRERSGCANANCHGCKGGGGGAVYVSAYASASDWDGFYARNAANQGLGYYESYAGGGAVYVDSKGAFSGSNTIFDTNEAANGGEEVYLEEVNTTLTLSCPSLMPTSMSGEECNYCAGTSRCVPWPTPQPSAVPTPVPVPRPTVNNVMTDSNIRTAVAA